MVQEATPTKHCVLCLPGSAVHRFMDTWDEIFYLDGSPTPVPGFGWILGAKSFSWIYPRGQLLYLGGCLGPNPLIRVSS